MDLVFYQIGQSSVYHLYLVTTQLIGSNKLGRKQIPQMNFIKKHHVNLNVFQVTSSLSWLRECQECAKLSSRQRVSTLKNQKYKIDFDLFNTSFGYYMIPYVLFHISSLLFYNVENSTNKEKSLNE
jgi:hypothetical protein